MGKGSGMRNNKKEIKIQSRINLNGGGLEKERRVRLGERWPGRKL